MAKSILDIVIRFAKEGNADKDTVGALVNIKSGVAGAMGVMAALAGVGYTLNQVYQGTVAVFLSYADQVRETSRLTGASISDSSRMIQMADDMGISYDNLQKSLWFASKNGIEVNIDSLARLAAQYSSFNSATDRATFLAKNFGKSGEDMGKFMALGAEGMKKLAEAQEKGLILTDEQVKKAHELEIAQDDLNDSWTVFTTNLASISVGPLTTLINHVNDLGRANEILNAQGIKTVSATSSQMNAAMAQAAAEREATTAIKEQTSALQAGDAEYETATEQAKAMAEAQKAVTDANTGLLGLTMSLQQEMGGYNQKLTEMTQKYGAASSQVRELQATHDQAMKQIIFNLEIAKLEAGGFTDAEYNQAIAAGVALGVIDQSTANMARAFDSTLPHIMEVQNAMAGTGPAVTEASTRVVTGQTNAAAAIDVSAAAFTNAHGPAESFTGDLTAMTTEARAASSQVNAIINHVKNLDGMTATVDIYIRTHGGGGIGVPLTPSVTTTGQRSVTGAPGRAAGGILGPISEVGEEGAEGIIQRPDGSYVVIPNSAWEEMKRLGLVDDIMNFRGGGHVPFVVRNRIKQGANPPRMWRQLNPHQLDSLGGGGGSGANPNRDDSGGGIPVDIQTLTQTLSAPTEAAATAAATMAVAASSQLVQAQKQADIAQANSNALIDEIRSLRTELPRTVSNAVKLAVTG